MTHYYNGTRKISQHCVTIHPMRESYLPRSNPLEELWRFVNYAQKKKEKEKSDPLILINLLIMSHTLKRIAFFNGLFSKGNLLQSSSIFQFLLRGAIYPFCKNQLSTLTRLMIQDSTSKTEFWNFIDNLSGIAGTNWQENCPMGALDWNMAQLSHTTAMYSSSEHKLGEHFLILQTQL